MKKRNIILLLLIGIILLVGCGKVINTETKTVKATVTDVHYRSSLILPVRCGKTVIYRTQPAKHNVTLKYKDISTTINNRDLYNEYKNNIGSTVECELITKHYDNGRISKELKIKK